MLKLGDLFDAIERLAVEVLESSADRAARREAVAAAWDPSLPATASTVQTAIHA